MTNDKKSFVLYGNYETQFKLLSMEERGMLITAIFEYVNFGSVSRELTPLVNMAFSFVKETLDRDRELYIEKCEKNAENGKKGGRPKKERKTEGYSDTSEKEDIFSAKTERFFEKPKKADNDNGIDNDNGNEKENDIDIFLDNGIDNGMGKKEKDNEKEKEELFQGSAFADRVPLGSALSEKEKKELIKKGLSESYIKEREARAAAYSAEKGSGIAETLLRWWQEDRAAKQKRGVPSGYGRAEPKREQSYEIDEFYQAALENTLSLMEEEFGISSG